MGIKFGTIDITGLNFGSTTINEAYFGSTLVFTSQRMDLFARWIEDRLTTITESDLAGVTNITYGAFSTLTNLTSINFPSTVQSFTIDWSSGSTRDCGISACVPPNIDITFSATGLYYQTYNNITYKMENNARTYVEYINKSATSIVFDSTSNVTGFGKSGDSSYYAPENSTSTSITFTRYFTTNTFSDINPLRNLSNLAKITVVSTNTSLKASSYLLYSYDGTILYAIPRKLATTTKTVLSGVTKIVYYCANKSNLTSITIPSTVTSIENYAFSNCTNLTSFTYQGTTADWGNVSKSTYWHENSAFTVVHCSDGDVTL